MPLSAESAQCTADQNQNTILVHQGSVKVNKSATPPSSADSTKITLFISTATVHAPRKQSHMFLSVTTKVPHPLLLRHRVYPWSAGGRTHVNIKTMLLQSRVRETHPLFA